MGYGIPAFIGMIESLNKNGIAEYNVLKKEHGKKTWQKNCAAVPFAVLRTAGSLLQRIRQL